MVLTCVDETLLLVLVLLPGRFALLLTQLLPDLVLQQGVVLMVLVDQGLLRGQQLGQQTVLR